jgi:hypothetical protein
VRIRSASIALVALLIAGSSMLRETPTKAAASPRADSALSALADTAVGRLDEMLRAGHAQLQFEGRSGYLRSLLESLHVPLESQVVTFSQASLHGARVTDEYPRAIFFSDDVAVAWAPQSSTIELTAYSRQRGLVFYTLEQSPDHPPHFTERHECVACHKSERTLDVPGLLVLSASRHANALPIATDHRTRLSDRWGGWYVTGLSRRWKHQGNRIGQGWLESLYDQFDTTGYPTLYSDIVALMVLEHQARASNMITRANSLSHSDQMGYEVGTVLDELVDYMLFADEAPIPATIVGISGFADWFSNRTPRDRSGRSVYQLDLKRRLFRYPVSFMIYSDVFDGLPSGMKTAVYARLLAALTSRQENGARDLRLSAAEKEAALEILVSTKPDFRDFVVHDMNQRN